MLVNYHFQKLNPSTIFVFDDTIKDTTYMKSPVMLGLLTEGRHQQISVFLTTQHLNSVNNKLRANFGYIIVS